MVEDNKKRRRSSAMPESVAELPNTKKSKGFVKKYLNLIQIDCLDTIPEAQQPEKMEDIERRKRVREILKVINRRLIEKDPYRICHSPPCSLLYPNYPFDKHLDMIMVAKRVDQLCYFNIGIQKNQASWKIMKN